MTEPNAPPPKKRPPNKAVQVGMVIGIVVGVVGFNAVAPRYFPPPPGGGFSWMQVLWAGLIGGICAGVGALVGMLVGGAARKK